MLITLSPQNPTPLYRQIAEQIKNKILQGELEAHESLPSIRQLAKELTTSVITTKKAYEELEREGWIYTRAGKGSYVAPIDRSARHERLLNSLKNQFQKLITEAVDSGITPHELEKAFQEVLQRCREEEN